MWSNLVATQQIILHLGFKEESQLKLFKLIFSLMTVNQSKLGLLDVNDKYFKCCKFVFAKMKY